MNKIEEEIGRILQPYWEEKKSPTITTTKELSKLFLSERQQLIEEAKKEIEKLPTDIEVSSRKLSGCVSKAQVLDILTKLGGER